MLLRKVACHLMFGIVLAAVVSGSARHCVAAEPTTTAPAEGLALKTDDVVVFLGDELTETPD